MKSILLLLLMVGCADRTYLNSGDAPGSGSVQNTDCSLKFKGSNLCIEWKWEKLPNESEMGQFYFKTYRLNKVDSSAILVDVEVLPKVVLWMPSMNHGSSPVRVSYEDTGTYRANDVFFIMPGDWEIKFQIIENNQVIDEAVVAIII